MLKVKPAVVEYNGKEYEIHLGTIGHTKLGREDHGIFTYVLDFDFGGSGQGAGTLALNDPLYFGKHIQTILDFFGCDWEQLPGKKAFVMREEHNGLVRGLVNEAETKAILFSEVSESVK